MLGLLSVYSEGLATGKKASNQSLASSPHRPFWFALPERFYESLQKAALEFQTTRAAIVTEAIKRKPEAPPEQKRTKVATGSLTEAAKEKLLKEFFSRTRRLGGQEDSASESSSPAFQPEDFSRIFWLDLPDTFFQQVRKKAKRYNMTEKQFVRHTVKQFIQDERKERRRFQPISDVQEQLVKEFSRTTGAMRWKQTSAKARKDHARMMALKRWGKTE